MSRNYMFDDKNAENRKKQRVEKQYELRQARRDDIITKKRIVTQLPPTDNTYNDLRLKIMSTDINEIYQATHEFRNILSCDDHPPIQKVIDTGVVPRLVELLSLNSACYINMNSETVRNTRLESAWALTNIASGDYNQTRTVIESGAIPLLVDMINDENPDVIDQGIWALGNIAGDNEISRDVILDSDVLPRLVSLMQKIIGDQKYIKLLRNATWLISNLNRGRNPPPAIENMQYSLQILSRLIHESDPETANDAFWALSYICDAGQRLIDMVLEADVLTKSMEYLNRSVAGDSTAKFLTCAIIRMIGNIVTGTDRQADIIIENGFLDIFSELYLKFRDPQRISKIKKEICWTISNIAAGTPQQVQQIFNKNLIPILIDALNSDTSIKMEASWAITNLISHCDKDEQIFINVMNSNLLIQLAEPLAHLAGHTDLIRQILSSIKKMLKIGEMFGSANNVENPVLISLRETRIPELVGSYIGNQSKNVSNQAEFIINSYFKN
ncbi:Importin subunit alpha-2 [Dictyocoela muelleri]|nr:Importin subunit alpha-2 [Dictyocoela muelleri]